MFDVNIFWDIYKTFSPDYIPRFIWISLIFPRLFNHIIFPDLWLTNIFLWLKFIAKSNIDNSNHLTKYGYKMFDVNIF